MILRANEHPIGSAVYLVEDTPDGPRRTQVAIVEMDAFGRPTFAGEHFGQDTIEVPDDERRIECITTTPGFARATEAQWKRGTWLVVDTETTGIGPEAEIVELGAVLMREGRVIDRRNVLVRPERPIPAEASAIHGIYDAHVAAAPRLHEPHPATSRSAAEGLCALAAKAHAIVGFNLVAFDQPLLERAIGWQWTEACAGLPVLDALVVVRLDGVDERPRSKGRHKLGVVAEWLGLTDPEPGMRVQTHRAAWDCVLAGRILWHLREHVPDDATEAHALIAREGKRQRDELDAYWARRGKR